MTALGDQPSHPLRAVMAATIVELPGDRRCAATGRGFSQPDLQQPRQPTGLAVVLALRIGSDRAASANRRTDDSHYSEHCDEGAY